VSAKRARKRRAVPRMPRNDCMAYDGRTLLGAIVQRGSKFIASNAAGKSIGTFKAFGQAHQAVLCSASTLAGGTAKPEARAA
jgi:hypothetical protein